MQLSRSRDLIDPCAGRAQHRFEVCDACALRGHHRRTGQRVQSAMPIRQRKAVARRDQRENHLEVGDFFVDVLVTHLMFPEKGVGPREFPTEQQALFPDARNPITQGITVETVT